MSKLKNNAYTLVVSAHPDDESIFFAAAILKSKNPVHVMCVTDGNADGNGELRKQQFKKALKILKVRSFNQLNLPDVFEKRLDLSLIQNALAQLPTPGQIFTHGPLGEYGHPHHQDLCLAVHQYFKGHKNLFGVAHNCEPDLIVPVTGDSFKKKSQLLSQVYFEETKRFINMVPLSPVEAFCHYDLKEVESVYNYLAGLSPTFNSRSLKKLKWFQPYLPQARTWETKRPF